MYQQLYHQVMAWIPEQSRVLDLGTGDGEFLARLIQMKQVVGEGVEKNMELVTRCIRRGLVVHQGDILDGLDQYADGSIDYILLLGTFQELSDFQMVLKETFRVGKHVIISYSNFAHLRARLQMMFSGRAPVTKSLPSPWYRTPNKHFFSILDFEDFCRAMKITQVKTACFNPRGRVRWWPNLRGDLAVSLLECDATALTDQATELAWKAGER
jgi:homoserine O-acetyltransferase/O-succinyltransferase